MKLLWCVAGVVMVIEANACGGSTTQTLDPNASFYNLSPEQQALFCDWQASLFGGYGKSIECGDSGQGSVSGPLDQTSCVQSFSQLEADSGGCSGTVGEVQTCAEWEVHMICNPSAGAPPAACAAIPSAQCNDS